LMSSDHVIMAQQSTKILEGARFEGPMTVIAPRRFIG